MYIAYLTKLFIFFLQIMGINIYLRILLNKYFYYYYYFYHPTLGCSTQSVCHSIFWLNNLWNFDLSKLPLYFDCCAKCLNRNWACFQDGQLLIPFIQVPFCLPSSCSNEDIVSGVQSMIDSQMDPNYGYFVILGWKDLLSPFIFTCVNFEEKTSNTDTCLIQFRLVPFELMVFLTVIMYKALKDFLKYIWLWWTLGLGAYSAFPLSLLCCLF